VDTNLAHHGLDRSSIPHLATAAMTVQRLLRNNPRDITPFDAEAIYARCFRT
jgi:alcohol dehydrogenase class IV